MHVVDSVEIRATRPSLVDAMGNPRGQTDSIWGHRQTLKAQGGITMLEVATFIAVSCTALFAEPPSTSIWSNIRPA